MAHAVKRTAVVLAVLLALPVSLGVHRLLPAAFDPVAVIEAGAEHAEAAVTAPVAAELVQQRAAARAVVAPARNLAARQPLRLAMAFTAMLVVLLVGASRRDPSRTDDPGPSHLLLLASTSARRGPPVVA